MTALNWVATAAKSALLLAASHEVRTASHCGPVEFQKVPMLLHSGAVAPVLLPSLNVCSVPQNWLISPVTGPAPPQKLRVSPQKGLVSSPLKLRILPLKLLILPLKLRILPPSAMIETDLGLTNMRSRVVVVPRLVTMLPVALTVLVRPPGVDWTVTMVGLSAVTTGVVTGATVVTLPSTGVVVVAMVVVTVPSTGVVVVVVVLTTPPRSDVRPPACAAETVHSAASATPANLAELIK